MRLQGSGDRPIKATFALVVSLLLLLPTAAPAKQMPCRDEGLVAIVPDDAPRVERAMRCLINRERSNRGLDSLRLNRDLMQSSEWQAQDMLRNEYFDHRRKGGPTFVKRIERFGYDGTLAGENLAWASAPALTPAAIVALWMDSPSHRENVLDDEFEDQAVAALWSNEPRGGDFATGAGPLIVIVSQFGAPCELSERCVRRSAAGR